MTKLYCPKGHENIKHYQELEFVQEAEGSKVVDKGDTGFCFDCKRRYFVIDCLKEPLANDTNVVTKNSNSAEIDGIKTDGCEHDLEEIVFTYPRPGGIPGFQKGYKCKKCGFIPKHEEVIKIEFSTETVNQYIPNFKTVDIKEKMSTESQKCGHVNDTDVVEKDKPYTIVLDYNLIEVKNLYNKDHYGLDGICKFCKKEQVPIQDKILVYETLDKKYNFNKIQEICEECYFEINNQHIPNFKTESQIAVDRVVEALSYAVDRDDPWFFNIGWEECCDSLGFKVINRFKNKLKELNK